MINRMLDWFKSLFWKEEMELTLVGLQHAGKTTFVNVIASGDFNEDMIPTVGFNMRKESQRFKLLLVLVGIGFLLLYYFYFPLNIESDIGGKNWSRAVNG